MAKNRHGNRHASSPRYSTPVHHQVRDFHLIASDPASLDLPEPIKARVPQPFRDPVAGLLAVEDRRTWHPEAHRPPVSSRRWNARVVWGAPASPARRPRFARRGVSTATRRATPPSSSYRFRFKFPRSVMVCVRRHRRREVLFAKRRTRGGSRARRWTSHSSVYCT